MSVPAAPSAGPQSRRLRFSAAALVVLPCLIVSTLYVRHVLSDPHIVLLTPQHDAMWIRTDAPFALLASRGETASMFRTRLPPEPAGYGGAVLNVLALGR